MTWIKLIDIFPGFEDPFLSSIWFLEGYGESSNIYVIEGDYLAFVDTGNDITAFFELFELGFKVEDIKKIFLTHAHNDHTLGLKELLMRYGGFRDIEVVVHDISTTMLSKAVEKFTEGRGSVIGVRGGEEVNLGGHDFKVIYTPGHTVDCICLYHEKTQTLFSGDTVLPIYLPEPDSLLGGDLRSYFFSIRNLLKMEVRNLLPGHFMPSFGEGGEIIESTYEGALRSQIPKGGRWIDAGIALADSGLFEEAIYCLDKALEEDPRSQEALGLKGSCLTDIGRNEEAIECFDKILEIREDEAAFHGKGMALMRLGKFEEALNCFDEALKINPDFREAAFGKGLVLSKLGRHEEAMKIEEFKRRFENMKFR
ncbi:MAG: MBL fold metallo-hydrolase [Candidatus Hydrothermarchaeota archaeon]